MTAIIVASLLLLALVGGIIGTVVIGIEGRGVGRLPRLDPWFHKLARHLNGEAPPPPAFVRLLRRLHVDAR